MYGFLSLKGLGLAYVMNSSISALSEAANTVNSSMSDLADAANTANILYIAAFLSFPTLQIL